MAQIVLLNKPYNVLCQFTDPDGRSTLADYIDTQRFANYYPAGRLDFDSEGLVILTNDGAIQHKISHPDSKSEKTYWAQVEGTPSDGELDQIRKGIRLKEGNAQPAKVKIIPPPDVWERTPPIRHRLNQPTSWLEIKISEGKNRQVRRMTAAINHPTLRLIRTSIGHWSIHKLSPGEFKTDTIHLPSNTPKNPRTRRVKK